MKTFDVTIVLKDYGQRGGDEERINFHKVEAEDCNEACRMCMDSLKDTSKWEVWYVNRLT